MTIPAVLASAFSNTSDEQLEKILSQRNPNGDTVGSVFDEVQTRETLLAACEKADEFRPAAHLDYAPAKYFRIPVKGTVGLIDLKSLDPGTRVALRDPHDTIGKEGGGALACIERDSLEGFPRADYSVVIIGPTRDDPSKYTVWTVHPGACAPMAPGATNDPEYKDRIVTVAEALTLGLAAAKVVITK